MAWLEARMTGIKTFLGGLVIWPDTCQIGTGLLPAPPAALGVGDPPLRAEAGC